MTHYIVTRRFVGVSTDVIEADSPAAAIRAVENGEGEHTHLEVQRWYATSGWTVHEDRADVE